ncbi:ABC transporter ATP-binding protein [Aquibacillus sp. 3ASR75-11]|uniref:ABC transporter ATP-binding protein n=1 Tax=Terrihalobacillus insolitus TaxID=2950438 RepID=A0A9X3WTQ1_9BACI|nr:ABC transporter ATP-binding protein [Terrihalobacillus insolitus]MDC3425772.1 ABC transporter ATP-binding protein [Terrihalobacillus insolitus]
MQLKNVSLAIEDKPVLRSINLNWAHGEAIALLGANGAGKSSLLKVMSTLLHPSTGKTTMPEGMSLQKWKSKLGVVFPETFLYSSLTGYENLLFYQKLYGKTDNEQIEQVFNQVNLSRVQQERVETYSKGMKQRLAIARAFVHQPTHLLLDEPFDGLDLASKTILERLLKEKNKQGVGYVLVSHDSAHAWDLCDRAVLLHNGKIVLETPCTEKTYRSFMNQYQGWLKEKQHDVF